MYEGSVCVYKGKKGLIVWKNHINPPCNFPPGPDEEETHSSERSLENLARKAA